MLKSILLSIMTIQPNKMKGLVLVYFTITLAAVSFADQQGNKIISRNFPSHSWGLNGNEAYIKTQGDGFYVRSPGLTGETGTVSFESASRPGYYLRHYGYLLYLEPKSKPRNAHIFDVDATFRRIENLWFDKTVSFESVNYRNYYIRHQNYRLMISMFSITPLFKNDASFMLENISTPETKPADLCENHKCSPGEVCDVMISLCLPDRECLPSRPVCIPQKGNKIISRNFPSHSWGLNGNEAYIKTQGDGFYVRSPGLTGETGTVSFESASRQGYYLRHYGYLLYLESKSNPRNAHIFDVDATFRRIENLWFDKTVSFESVNYRNYYIRHQNYRLKISMFSNTPLFKNDASFMLENISTPETVEKKGKLVSHNYPAYSWGLDGWNAFIKRNGDEFHLRTPGLTLEAGTVSFESVTKPGHFLRHYGYLLFLEPKSNPRNPQIFNLDATFRKIENLWFPGTLAFESVNFPSFYIRHQNGRLKISKFNNTPLFKNDASFQLQQQI